MGTRGRWKLGGRQGVGASLLASVSVGMSVTGVGIPFVLFLLTSLSLKVLSGAFLAICGVVRIPESPALRCSATESFC